MSLLLVAALGTDHHPFDRLVRWLDAVADRRSGCDVVVQHGHSMPPVVAAGLAFVPHAELMHLLRAADIVVSHGGPGALMDAKHAGHVPVLVPRDPERGEHVDGHQLRFALAMEGSGAVRVARDQQEFDRIIDQRVATRARRDAGPEPTVEVPAGLSGLIEEIDRLPVQPRRLTPVLRTVRRVVQR